MGRDEGERLEASAYDTYRADAVHARPVYLGSGYSEFPCGLDGRTPAMVAAWDSDVTCPDCLVEMQRRARAGSHPPVECAVATHALAVRVDTRDGAACAPTLVAPCGAEWPVALVGSPQWRESADIDAVTCPACRKAVGQ